MPSKIDRTGETAHNTKGLLMKIVEYNSFRDMVVEFVEDGERVSGVAYQDFKKGKVSHPKNKVTAKIRVGETSINTQGRLMKIVEYNGNKDMVVEFEDGERVSGVAYKDFKEGYVRHPKDKVTAEKRVGETSINTKGHFMKIVEYNSFRDMLVEFEDGERVSGVSYTNFKKGYVRHPKDKDRTGETSINTQGRLMKIVKYNNCMDMVVEFEDGERVSGVRYHDFKKGNVCHPNDKVTPEDRVGETAYNNQGRLMKIVEYNSSHDMVVEFEDGERVSGVRYDNFKKGNVRHPKDKDRTGETAINTKGLLMKIVEYNSAMDMVVEFEDGERVSGVAYGCFKKGKVLHPKDKDRTGETSINTQGLLMKIVEYNSFRDMVVEFEDGVRVNRVQYDNFKRGNVRHPKDKATAENRVGETATATNGQTIRIIEYISSSNVMIQFLGDDLSPIKTTYRCFKTGTVKNPHFPMKGKGRYKTFQTEYAYTTPSGEVYFYCECQNCGWKKNMKADEAINCNHVCEEKEAEINAKKDR